MKKNIWISESRNSREYSSRFLENLKITGNRCIGGNNYMMSVISENAAKGVSVPEAGQFYMFQLKNQIRILRRPISIHNIDYKTGKLEFLYRVSGKGTKELSRLSTGDILNIQGPLGKGFDIPDNIKNIIIAGGGIGLAPLKLLMLKILENKEDIKITFIAGGRDKNILKLIERFELEYENIETIICTDNGSIGEKSDIIGILKRVIESDKNIDMIYSCAPHSALEIISRIANENGIASQISVEERMACGVGACVGCSIESNYGMKKVCRDGPVFYSSIFMESVRDGSEINV